MFQREGSVHHIHDQEAVEAQAVLAVAGTIKKVPQMGRIKKCLGNGGGRRINILFGFRVNFIFDGSHDLPHFFHHNIAALFPGE